MDIYFDGVPINLFLMLSVLQELIHVATSTTAIAATITTIYTHEEEVQEVIIEDNNHNVLV
jgi:hypothetical protein